MLNIDDPRRKRFLRLAEKRTNEVLRKVRILGNCSNRQAYDYDKEDVEKIFSAIDRKVKEVRAKFQSQEGPDFKL